MLIPPKLTRLPARARRRDFTFFACPVLPPFAAPLCCSLCTFSSRPPALGPLALSHTLALPALHPAAGHAGAGLTPNVHFFRPRIFKTVQLRHGYLRLAANATHLQHEVVASLEGSLMDSFSLYKPADWRFQPRPATLVRGGVGVEEGKLRRGGPLVAVA